MKAMCKMAVNRAALLLEIINDLELWSIFQVDAAACTEWDNPEQAPDLEKLWVLLNKEAGNSTIRKGDRRLNSEKA